VVGVLKANPLPLRGTSTPAPFPGLCFKMGVASRFQLPRSSTPCDPGPRGLRPDARLGDVPTWFLYRLHLARRANQGLAWGVGESWLLQRRTRAPCWGCWPGRSDPQAQPILPAVSVGPRDAARSSPSTTRRTHARSTRNGGLSTNTPVRDAGRKTHRGVRWKSGTCSWSGSAASSEPSAAALHGDHLVRLRSRPALYPQQARLRTRVPVCTERLVGYVPSPTVFRTASRPPARRPMKAGWRTIDPTSPVPAILRRLGLASGSSSPATPSQPASSAHSRPDLLTLGFLLVAGLLIALAIAKRKAARTESPG
jgi:hypothetical protein